jgi:hypothetical protein
MKIQICGAGVLSYKFWFFKTSDYFILHSKNESAHWHPEMERSWLRHDICASE